MLSKIALNGSAATMMIVIPEHSSAPTTVERLHLDDTRQRLIVDVDFTDPEFFKQPPARETMEYSPSDLKMSRSSVRPRV